MTQLTTPQPSYGSSKPYRPTVPDRKRDFGKDVAQDFLIDPEYRNMNHGKLLICASAGSFGTIPRAVQAARRYYDDQSEARPDIWTRYDSFEILRRSRAAVAPLLGVDIETVVFIPNATMGVNAVLRNLVWNEDSKDEMLYFDTIYGACGNTIKYLEEVSWGHVSTKAIPLSYPLTDDQVVALFKKAIRDSRAAGRRPRAAVIDVVSSIPAVRVPFERLVGICREESILSVVDGAQGIGMVDLRHVGPQVKPDFFISNCHKWLFAPRGCAVLHVPKHNQHLMRSSLPTSWGWLPTGSGDPDFVSSFSTSGTLDKSNHLCVQDAIRWRQEVLGGEDAIIKYTTDLNKRGGKRVAEMLGTEVLENSEGTLTNCAMCNVLLPVGLKGSGSHVKVAIDKEDEAGLADWCQRKLGSDYNTWMPVSYVQGKWWARISAQVYLDDSDYEATGDVLLSLCDSLERGDHKTKTKKT